MAIFGGSVFFLSLSLEEEGRGRSLEIEVAVPIRAKKLCSKRKNTGCKGAETRRANERPSSEMEQSRRRNSHRPCFVMVSWQTGWLTMRHGKTRIFFFLTRVSTATRHEKLTRSTDIFLSLLFFFSTKMFNYGAC